MTSVTTGAECLCTVHCAPRLGSADLFSIQDYECLLLICVLRLASVSIIAIALLCFQCSPTSSRTIVATRTIPSSTPAGVNNMYSAIVTYSVHMRLHAHHVVSVALAS